MNILALNGQLTAGELRDALSQPREPRQNGQRP
jgi:hypothetical protein